MKRFIILIITFMFLSGCGGAVQPSDNCPTELLLKASVTRYIDLEAEVVCYYYVSSIECLPLSQTNLR